jgi:hypothetical protein
MPIKTILPAAVIVLATATGAFAQQMPNDRTGDHMFSYGAAAAPVGPTRVQHVERQVKHRAAPGVAAPIDRTADHMLYYGPVAQ